LDSLNDIRKVFRIRGKYENLTFKGGYEKLYKMAITICKQLFGDDIIMTTNKHKRISGKRVNIVNYNLNNLYLDKCKNLF
jgi:hypothetical protein